MQRNLPYTVCYRGIFELQTGRTVCKEPLPVTELKHSATFRNSRKGCAKESCCQQTGRTVNVFKCHVDEGESIYLGTDMNYSVYI